MLFMYANKYNIVLGMAQTYLLVFFILYLFFSQNPPTKRWCHQRRDILILKDLNLRMCYVFPE